MYRPSRYRSDTPDRRARSAPLRLPRSEALGKHRSPRKCVDGELHGIEEVGKTLDAERLSDWSGEQNDVCHRSRRVGPLDVQRGLEGTTRCEIRSGDAIADCSVIEVGCAEREDLVEVR